MAAVEPRYLRVVEALTRLITAGVYREGDPLPQARDLAERYEVGLGTIGDALRELKRKGLVETKRGVGTVVRRRPVVRRKAMSRYRADLEQARASGGLPPETSFTRDRDLAWSDYRVDCVIDTISADATLAELFEVAAETLLLRRRLVFYDHDVPQQMSHSHFLLDMVAGTPVADPANEPWPGGSIAQLWSVGVEVTAVEEEMGARLPADDEVATLLIPDGIPVVTVTRQMLAGDRVVEVAADIVMPADRIRLRSRIDL